MDTNNTDLISKLAASHELRIEQLINSSEKTISNIRATWQIIFPAVTTIVFIASGFSVFYGIDSLKDVRQEVMKVAQLEVSKTLKDKQGIVIETDLLSEQLSSAQRKLKVTQETIDALLKQGENEAALSQDINALYDSLSDPEVNRALKMQNLRKLIDYGIQGLADTNTLFNASTDAGNLDFKFEALQLLSVLSSLDPKPIYTIRRLRYENIFGYRFKLVNGELVRSTETPDQVRLNAWNLAKEVVQNNPLEDSHLLYAELWNIAERSNYAGYQADAISLILSLESQYQDQLTSYPLVILAQLYARQSKSEWHENTWKSVDKAMILFQSESPLAPWYSQTRDELCELAVSINSEEKMNSLFEQYGSPPCSKASEAPINNQDIRALIDLLTEQS